MAKFVCLFALAGLAAAGPLGVSNQDTVISSILTSLQPSIDAAIARALGESQFSSVTVQETVGPISFSGSSGNTDYQGSYGSEQSSFTSSFESSGSGSGSGSAAAAGTGSTFQSAGVGGVVFHNGAQSADNTAASFSGQISGGNTGFSGQVASHQTSGSKYQTSGNKYQTSGSGSAQFSAGQQVSQGAQKQVSAAGISSGSTFQSAGVGGVVFHDGASTASQEAVSTGHFSSAAHGGQQSVSHTSGNVAGSTQGLNVEKVTKVTVSANNQQAVVQNVMNALVPSVQAAVQAALLKYQQSQVASSTFSTQGQQTSGSTQTSGVTTTTVTETSISAAEETALVARIIKVLTPSITTSVRKALAARIQTVNANKQSSFGVSQQSSNQQSSFGTSQSTFGSNQQFSGNQQAFGANTQNSFSANQQSASQTSSSNASSGKLVSQIVAALRPSIALSVAEALEASRVSSQVSNSAFNVQSANTGFSSQAANSGFNSQSSSAQSSSFSSGGASSGAVSSGTLSSIFGNGDIHNVRVETPEYKIEYNN